VRKLGFSATELSKMLGLSQPSVSISVKRGEKIAKVDQLEHAERGQSQLDPRWADRMAKTALSGVGFGQA
jgi:predicted transcriptional regulator